MPDSQQSVSKRGGATFHQFSEALSTILLLASGFLAPLIEIWFLRFNMGKKFDPANDVQDLEGKVILVTGGMVSCIPDLEVRHTDTTQ